MSDLLIARKVLREALTRWHGSKVEALLNYATEAVFIVLSVSEPGFSFIFVFRRGRGWGWACKQSQVLSFVLEGYLVQSPVLPYLGIDSYLQKPPTPTHLQMWHQCRNTFAKSITTPVVPDFFELYPKAACRLGSFQSCNHQIMPPSHWEKKPKLNIKQKKLTSREVWQKQGNTALLKLQRKTGNDAGIRKDAAVSAFIPFYH